MTYMRGIDNGESVVRHRQEISDKSHHSFEIPLVAEDLLDQKRVLRGMNAIDAVVTGIDKGVNGYRRGHTYAVITAQGAASFWASMNGMR